MEVRADILRGHIALIRDCDTAATFADLGPVLQFWQYDAIELTPDAARQLGEALTAWADRKDTRPGPGRPGRESTDREAECGAFAAQSSDDAPREVGTCLWANQICEQPNHHGCTTCLAVEPGWRGGSDA